VNSRIPALVGKGSAKSAAEGVWKGISRETVDEICIQDDGRGRTRQHAWLRARYARCKPHKGNSRRPRLANSSESALSRARPQDAASGYFTRAIRQTLKKVSNFVPNLSMFPPPQLKLWPALGATPEIFTLYGGTALALRLAHRSSDDFDFLSNTPFDPERLAAMLPYLKDAERVRVARTHSLVAWIVTVRC